MNNKNSLPCDGLMDYLTGESSAIERKRFEKHLVTCLAEGNSHSGAGAGVHGGLDASGNIENAA